MNEKFCQSCGMPLNAVSDLGNNEDGSKNEDFCSYCFKDGKYTADMTMEQMIDFCTPIMVEEGMQEEAARKMMNEYFPQLKRWKKQ